METRLKLAIILLLFLLPTIQAVCTVTPNNPNPQTGNTVTYTIGNPTQTTTSKCKDADVAQGVNGNTFSCTYDTAGTYTATVNTFDQDNLPADICTAQITVTTPQQAPQANPLCGTCTNRVKYTCGADQQNPQGSPVPCCSASDCSTTCTGNRATQQTCSASNQCVASGSGGFVIGQCGYNPVCALAVSRNSVTEGDGLGISVNYDKFLSSAPGSVTVNCGDGTTATASGCDGSSGGCRGLATCSYKKAGSYTASAVIQDTVCQGVSVTVRALNAPAAPASCSASVSSGRVEVGNIVEVTNSYSNLPKEAGQVQVACGDGTGVTGKCSGTTGTCTVICNYTLPGTYRPSVTLSGSFCTGAEVTVVPKPLSSRRLEPVVEIKTAASTPSPIIETTQTKVSLTTDSNEAFANVSCTSPEGSGRCSCALTSSGLSPLVECTITPPVKGSYQLKFFASDGRSKEANIQLTPGSAAIAVENISSNPELTFWAAVALVALLVAYAVYYLWGKLEAKLTYKEKMLERRKLLMREMEVAKFRFMKGEIGQKEFEEQYKAKQKEVTELNTKIDEVEKQENK